MILKQNFHLNYFKLLHNRYRLYNRSIVLLIFFNATFLKMGVAHPIGVTKANLERGRGREMKY